MRAIYATIFLSMFLLNVSCEYTVLQSNDMTPAEKRAIKAIILKVCPIRRSQCNANNNVANDITRRVENKFSGKWSAVLFKENGYGASISHYKYYEVDYKGIKWMIFQISY